MKTLFWILRNFLKRIQKTNKVLFRNFLQLDLNSSMLFSHIENQKVNKHFRKHWIMLQCFMFPSKQQKSPTFLPSNNVKTHSESTAHKTPVNITRKFPWIKFGWWWNIFVSKQGRNDDKLRHGEGILMASKHLKSPRNFSICVPKWNFPEHFFSLSRLFFGPKISINNFSKVGWMRKFQWLMNSVHEFEEKFIFMSVFIALYKRM